MDKIVTFSQTAPTRMRLIHNAVEIAATNRKLSHDDVTLQMMATFEKRAIELADRWATATAADIAAQLLREQTRKRQRRSPNRPSSASGVHTAWETIEGRSKG